MYSRSLSSMTSLESGKKSVDGIDIYFERAGEGKHGILCLPGALGAARSDFGPVFDVLSKHPTFSVIGWDPPGYGSSRPPDRDFSSDFFHKDASLAYGLMKAIGFKKFSMLGWSDGGNTAFILAAKYPHAVHKLVAWGSNSYVSDNDMKLYKAIADMSQWSERMRAPMFNMYGAEGAQKLWTEWVHAFAWFHSQNKGNIYRELLPDVKCPVLVVHGAKDAVVGEEHPNYLHQHLPNSRLKIYPDGKHNLHLKYADQFCSDVTEFLLEPSSTISAL